MKRSGSLGWCAPLLLLAVGCSGASPTRAGDEDGRVREAFQALQSALKSRDADKIWALLDKDSQAAADRAARTLRERYEKADGPGRDKLVKTLGLSLTETAELNGQRFVKSNVFQLKYDELSASKITKPPAIQGDKATVYYEEPDGDLEELTLIREGGQWKASLAMPSLPPV